MPQIYDLEGRTLNFAKQCRNFCKQLPKNISNYEYSKQLIRSSASIGANYIEANESLGKKDFLMRLKISKKETKESQYWLQLVEPEKSSELTRNKLIQESTELMKIFGAILDKSK